MSWFPLRNITYQCVFCWSSPLKKPRILEKKQFLWSVLILEQRTNQRQFNAQTNNDSVWTYLCDLAWNWYPVFRPFLKIFRVRVSDSRLDISTTSEPNWCIYISKSKFGRRQPETNQISKNWRCKYCFTAR